MMPSPGRNRRVWFYLPEDAEFGRNIDGEGRVSARYRENGKSQKYLFQGPVFMFYFCICMLCLRSIQNVRETRKLLIEYQLRRRHKGEFDYINSILGFNPRTRHKVIFRL